MALKEPLMVKTVMGGTSLSLQPPVGEAYVVRDVYIEPGSASTVTFTIDKTTVGFWYVSGTQLNDLSVGAATSNYPNMLRVLHDNNVFRPYPVASGQTFTVSTDGEEWTYCVVEYEIYDEADVKPTDVNGSASSEYDVILYGKPSVVTPDKYSLYDTPLDPDEFPKFPYGAVVPSKSVITLHGILMYTIGSTDNSGADKGRTKFLKWQKDRVVLFDNDKNGLPYYGYPTNNDGIVKEAPQLIDYAVSNDSRNLVLFRKPLVFDSGEDLDIYIYTETVAGTSPITSDDLRMGLIATIKQTA